MQNSRMVFTFSALDLKYPFWENLVQTMEIVSLSWNLVPRLIRICIIHWCCSLFLFSTCKFCLKIWHFWRIWHFDVTWSIFQLITHRDLKPVAFLVCIKFSSNCMFLLDQYYLKFCQVSFGPYNVSIINVGMSIGNVKLRQTFPW